MPEQDSLGSPAPASFKGRLQLDSFKYSGPETRLLRRSPRHSASASAAPSPSPGRSPSHRASSTSSRKRSRSSPSSREALPTSSESPSTDSRSPSQSTTGGSGSKRKRASTGYAPPSTYAHLPHLPDAILPNLIVLFVGLNPGVQTARTGHAYAHPSNLFWKLLFSSGITPRPCRADEDRQMPALYALGNTNIVARPSRNGSELSKQEMDDGVAALEDKARKWRPECMCIVGKSIWESIWRVRHGGSKVGGAFKYGWQDESENMGVIDGEWSGAKVFVATSTSGLAASLSPAEKQAIWNELGSWVKKRRAEREAEAGTDTATTEQVSA
ncbi:mismatch-specific thymine-DNA glycosylate [Purpureocillium lilacinum]|uniref:Mismatch-specific thymine-DNA glycosylate n=1 Tax=Purpureocillium lilacinum TaxID=33203 RepID=A0A179GZ75_PURLI|nr:mismatch-specific thymine-DNA glycosylate [Purpureocillium lilacinum]OAQ76149.1 mismatch-specific thymine-DNA glycosylate [Purpureocillium lilacinum]OAQ83305.1 mismatch-specific thymine-DNA glycosylate [Purpureocillium lilacinum]